jgi:cytochrome c-type biogenesis protein CcmH/NrfG
MPEPAAHREILFIETVRRLIDIKRYDLLEARSREYCQEFPENPTGHYFLGLSLKGQEKLEQAEQELREALRLDPEMIPAYGILGAIKAQQGLHREAEQLYLAALKLDPSDVGVLTQYGHLMAMTGFHDKAERLYREALRIDPENQNTHALLSTLHAQQSDSSMSQVHAEKSIELSPDEQVSHVAMGVHYFRSGRPFLARKHLKEAMRIDPTDTSLQEIYLESRKACRWYFLPIYYLALWADRLPGGQWTLWIGVIVLLRVLGSVDVVQPVIGYVALAWLIFCLYTLVIGPIANWLERRSPNP